MRPKIKKDVPQPTSRRFAVFSLWEIVIFVSFPCFAIAANDLSCLYELARFSGTTETHDVIDRYDRLVSESSKGLRGYFRSSWWGIHFGEFYLYNSQRKAQILAHQRFAAYLGRVLEQTENLRLQSAEIARLQTLQAESIQVAARLEEEMVEVYRSSSGRSGLSVYRLNSRVDRLGNDTWELERLSARAREVAGLLDGARAKLAGNQREPLADEADELAFRQLATTDSVQKKRQAYLTALNRPSRIQFRYVVHRRRRVASVRHAATYWSLPYTEYETENSSYTATRYISYAEAVLWGYTSENPAEAIARTEGTFVAVAQQAENLLDEFIRTEPSILRSREEASSPVDRNRRKLAEYRASLERYSRSADADILAQCSDDSPEEFRRRNSALLEWYDALLERNAVCQNQIQNKSPYLLPFPR
jgi:hypothetical protein